MKQTDTILAAGIEGRKQHIGRSPIFVWMWERYDTYGDQLSERGTDWAGMAKQFAAKGITDGRGKAPTGKTVAATFYKVRKVKEGLKPKRRPASVKREIKRDFHRNAA